MGNDIPEDNKEGQKEKIEKYKEPLFTGEGYLQVEALIDNVKAWQQRKILCEDVDYLESQGGTGQ